MGLITVLEVVEVSDRVQESVCTTPGTQTGGPLSLAEGY